MEKVCKYCGQLIKYDTVQQYVSHTGNCKFGPNWKRKCENISKSMKRFWNVKEFVFECKNCGGKFTYEMTQSAYNKAKENGTLRKFCNVKCSSMYNLIWGNKQSINEELFECPWCSKTFTPHGMKSHVWRVHTEEGRNFISGGKFNNPPWNKGLTKETDDRIRRQGISTSNTLKGRKGFSPSQKTRERISKTMLKNIENGQSTKQCGRAKKYEYDSIDNGVIKVDGSWELRVAKYLDVLGVKWRRNTKRFWFKSNIKNRKAIYIPDFYVYDWETYIEVKGYKTELDDEKWSQFPEPLEIWDEKKLKELNIL